MTPQTMMGRFGPDNLDGMVRLNIDHIFVDEVGYCCAINILPLFAYHVPITFLGTICNCRRSARSRNPLSSDRQWSDSTIG